MTAARGTERGLLLLLVLVLACLASAPSAWARPAVTLKMTPIAIPGVSGTGDVLGAGAEVQAQVTIAGSEYAGSPSPLTGMTLYAPAGLRVNPAGFPACAPSVLEAQG